MRGVRIKPPRSGEDTSEHVVSAGLKDLLPKDVTVLIDLDE
jgi:hypothetical protein